MNILLICKYNRFRSKVAEAFFNKYTSHRVKSVGIIKGIPVDDDIRDAASNFGLELDKSIRTLSWNILNWQEHVIVVADNIPPKLFDDVPQVKNLEVWKIPDAHMSDRNKIIELIEQKVKMFDNVLVE